MIAIIDYGMGNPSSIRNMLVRLGHEARMARTPADAKSANRIILPGVGAFDEGMTRLADLGWADCLRGNAAPGGRPVLGICLGMQLLFSQSEEGRLPGLGLIEGSVIKFRFESGISPVPRVPNMGWRSVQSKGRGAPDLFAGLEDEARFYFVHSYHCRCSDERHIAGLTDYGFTFTSAVRRGALYGVQFHPEKSHRYGMRLLDNYARITSS